MCTGTKFTSPVGTGFETTDRACIVMPSSNKMWSLMLLGFLNATIGGTGMALYSLSDLWRVRRLTTTPILRDGMW